MRRASSEPRSEDACHWRTDAKIGRYFVPGCMGGAVYGEGRCTCQHRRASTAGRLAALEDQVESLTARLEAALAPNTTEGRTDRA